LRMFSDCGALQISADESQLITRARLGDDVAFAALVGEYRRLIHWHVSHSASDIAAKYRDDLFQEGLVGLLGAVRTYDGVSSVFKTYASSCISNSVVGAARRYRKQDGGETVPLDETELASWQSPESDFLDRESSSILYERIFSELSAYESAVFELYLSDRSYAEIARVMHKSEKSIANAICRIRKKLRELLA